MPIADPPNDFPPVEASVRHLPGGEELCVRIRAALQSPINNEWTQPYWYQIGCALIYCMGFPEEEFHVIRVSEPFDVRWPLSFACWYWTSSGFPAPQEIFSCVLKAAARCLLRSEQISAHTRFHLITTRSTNQPRAAA